MLWIERKQEMKEKNKRTSQRLSSHWILFRRMKTFEAIIMMVWERGREGNGKRRLSYIALNYRWCLSFLKKAQLYLSSLSHHTSLSLSSSLSHLASYVFFIILLMQFNQNTVTRYEYKISLLLPVLLSYESLENNIFWRMARRRKNRHSDEENRAEEREGEIRKHHPSCINMNGAWSMQKMKILLSFTIVVWCEIVCYGTTLWQ